MDDDEETTASKKRRLRPRPVNAGPAEHRAAPRGPKRPPFTDVLGRAARGSLRIAVTQWRKNPADGRPRPANMVQAELNKRNTAQGQTLAPRRRAANNGAAFGRNSRVAHRQGGRARVRATARSIFCSRRAMHAQQKTGHQGRMPSAPNTSLSGKRDDARGVGGKKHFPDHGRKGRTTRDTHGAGFVSAKEELDGGPQGRRPGPCGNGLESVAWFMPGFSLPHARSVLDSRRPSGSVGRFISCHGRAN